MYRRVGVYVWVCGCACVCVHALPPEGQVLMQVLEAGLYHWPHVALCVGRLPSKLKRNSPKAFFVSQRFLQSCYRKAESQKGKKFLHVYFSPRYLKNTSGYMIFLLVFFF